MPPLFPTIPNPPTPSIARPSTRQYLPTIRINWDAPYGPDFGLDSSGRLVMVDKQQAWVQAGIAASLTQRAAFLVFPRWFGWDIERAMQRESRGQTEADIKRGVTYAWTRCTQGRTADVQQFSFDWVNDQIIVSFRPIPSPGLGLRAVHLEVTY
jgi:hypothetical protein